MSNLYFITGTDTDAGKTFSAAVIEQTLLKHGVSVCPFKPIVAGFENGENQDLNSHCAATKIGLKPLEITACTYEEPIAPHIAAIKTNNEITFEKLNKKFEELIALNKDVYITEGAGGWLLPIGNNKVLPDWPRLKEMEIILVVGMKLGCLNHALLTLESIKSRGFKIKAFVTCQPTKDKIPYYDENVQTLKAMMNIPYLGDIPFETSGDFRNSKAQLDISCLI